MANQIVQTKSGWLVRHKERIGLVAIGHTAKQLEEALFDWLLYGTVNAFLTTVYGPVWGSVWTFAVMAPFSALICYGYIRMYDWAKKDWFGFEAVKSVREDLEGSGIGKRIVRFMLRMGDVPAFFALSITADPFFVTIYLRKGSERYDGLTRRDWFIFFASVLVSNGYWTLRWTVIVGVALWIWGHIPDSIQAGLLGCWDAIVAAAMMLF